MQTRNFLLLSPLLLSSSHSPSLRFFPTPEKLFKDRTIRGEVGGEIGLPRRRVGDEGKKGE
jgi:hypothetical protein